MSACGVTEGLRTADLVCACGVTEGLRTAHPVSACGVTESLRTVHLVSAYCVTERMVGPESACRVTLTPTGGHSQSLIVRLNYRETTLSRREANCYLFICLFVLIGGWGVGGND